MAILLCIRWQDIRQVHCSLLYLNEAAWTQHACYSPQSVMSSVASTMIGQACGRRDTGAHGLVTYSLADGFAGCLSCCSSCLLLQCLPFCGPQLKPGASSILGCIGMHLWKV